MRQTICSTNYKEAIEQLTDNIDDHSQQIQMLEAQLVNSNRQSEMKITELQVQLNTSIQILQADKDSFNESLQLVKAQLDNSNERFGGQIMELQVQLNNSNQLLQKLQNQLSATTAVLQQSLSEQENRLGNIQLIVEELEKVRLGGVNNPASSCSDIPQDRPSGEYWIATDSTSSPVQVYCDMNRTSCSCNTAGGWMRVANLDMTDPNQNCPEGLSLVTRGEPPLRTCGGIEGPGCTSTTYSTDGVEYSKVCGRIIAYQSGSPDAFSPYFRNTIDDVYVDGVSLTHGQSPRQHIWTFAGAHLMKLDPIDRYVPALDLTSSILESYLPSSVKTTSVKLEVDKHLVISSILMIPSGMVRDAGLSVLAVSLTIHRGFASNSLNQLQTISS